MTAAKLKSRLELFISEIWNHGDADADVILHRATRIHHAPGDLWNGHALDWASYQERVRLSRAPFPNQKFAIERCDGHGLR
jgi:hypothetical protein